MTQPQPPGWYPTNQPDTEAWWDGRQWTNQTRPAQVGVATQVVPPGYQLTRKKSVFKRVWFWLLAAFLLFVVLIIVIIASAASSVNKAVNNQHTVVYKVTSNGKTASITYDSITGGNVGQEQSNNAPLPWTKSVSGKGDFSVFSLVAQAEQNATTISCSISIDGAVKSSKTSTGQFAVVSCSANAS